MHIFEDAVHLEARTLPAERQVDSARLDVCARPRVTALQDESLGERALPVPLGSTLDP
jgi:hypothetical protein